MEGGFRRAGESGEQASVQPSLWTCGRSLCLMATLTVSHVGTEKGDGSRTRSVPCSFQGHVLYRPVRKHVGIIMMRERDAHGRKLMLDVGDEIQYIVDPAKRTFVVTTQRGVHDLELRALRGLGDRDDVHLRLQARQRLSEITRIESPERLDVVIDLVVLVRKLYVVLHDVVPPEERQPIRVRRGRDGDDDGPSVET